MITPEAIKSRAVWFQWILLIACLIIVLRLSYLQVKHADYFFQKGQQNFLRFEDIASPRGNIYDRHGNLFVTNRPVINLLWRGHGRKSFTEEQYKIIELLGVILGKSLLSDPSIMQDIAHAERFYRSCLLARDITFTQLSKIEEQLFNHPSIRVEHCFERFYPHKHLASHTLGYLNNPLRIDQVGQMGLEKILEEMLKGHPGIIAKTKNSKGKDLHEEQVKAAEPGSNITTTLDIPLQQLAEKEFPMGFAGAFLLFNPRTGDILSAVSRPSFNPAVFLSSITLDQWALLQENRPFLNRAFNAAYPPGSVFKLITIAAAMEYGLLDEDTMWNCKGHVFFGKRKYWCNKRDGHGIISTKQAVALSCNVLFYEVAQQLDIDRLAEYAQRFGLGTPTHLLLPEKTGLIPSRAWKQVEKGEPWWTGETLSVAIGQSYVLCTPLQIARMIGAIFTGQLVKPRIVENEQREAVSVPISKNTRDFLKKSMRAVVKTGTGKRVSSIEDIKIYAKTSTAQTSSLAKRRFGKEYQEHGWFVAYFEYKDHEPLVLVCLVENAGSARLAAVMAKNFLLGYKKIMDSLTA